METYGVEDWPRVKGEVFKALRKLKVARKKEEEEEQDNELRLRQFSTFEVTKERIRRVTKRQLKMEANRRSYLFYLFAVLYEMLYVLGL